MKQLDGIALENTEITLDLRGIPVERLAQIKKTWLSPHSIAFTGNDSYKQV